MLEGTLEAFTLPDIFQLLAFTKKTGCLELQRDDAVGAVYFRDGEVYFAVAPGGRLALGRRLVGAGLVTTQELEAALAEQRQRRDRGQALRIGRILVEAGAIDEETLEVALREQIQDAVFDLMRWTEGRFRFITSGPEATIDEPVTLSVSVENLIMEGTRRLEEWDAIRRKIPSLDAVVAMAPVPGDTGVEVNLKPEEWRLLMLVDGQRTVGELVRLSGQGEFGTCRILFGLVSAGLLEVRDVATDGPPSVAALLAQQELLRALEEEDGAAAPSPSARTAADRPTAVGTPPEPLEVELELGDTPAAPTTAAAPVIRPPAEGSTAAAAAPDADLEQVTRQLVTDPSIDADLLRRLIDGIKEL